MNDIYNIIATDMLHNIAVTSLTIAGLCSALILINMARGRKQRILIMNIVWPVTALYSGPVGLPPYVLYGMTLDNPPVPPRCCRTKKGASVAIPCDRPASVSLSFLHVFF